MDRHPAIETPDVLEFVIFCIENTAIHLGKSGREVLKLLKDDSDILDEE